MNNLKNMKRIVVAVALACGGIAAAPVSAQVSFAVSTPGLSIGVNLPAYPQLVPVPGYPVYYAPSLNSNYFFYDGLYWVYSNDNWYESTWYNGPWTLVEPDYVPVFILRVPVRYYRRPPTYFRAWTASAPPRWGEHWGHSWEDQRRGWDNWDRRAAPAPAPLPVYQRQYAGNRYPRVEQQRSLESQNYHYSPRDPVVQQRFQAQRSAPVQAQQPAPQPSRAVNQAERPQVPNQRQIERPAQAMPTPTPDNQRQAQQPKPERQAQQPPPQRQAQQPPPQPPQQQQRQAQQPKPERQAQQPQPQRQAQQPPPQQQHQAQQPKPERQAQQPKPERQAQQPKPAPQPQAERAQPQAQQVAQQQHEQPAPSRGEQPKGEGKGEGKGKGQDGH